MNELKIEVKKLMNVEGVTTYTLYVNEEKIKESQDYGVIRGLVDTLETGFENGDLTESVIYSNTLTK